MAKYLAQIILAGSQIVARAFARAVKEEIAASQDAARRLGNSSKTRAERLSNVKTGITLEEAKQILNVSNLDKDEITRRYEVLFKANEKSNGGSFYIQSKIFRAKERIDMEFSEPDTDKSKTESTS
ncbi:hypothetical protein QE152_g1480 [Popillia japonica]|uniref:Mitochondrial import inner membrane translocase subunit Tim16 n=1 Tax=Popillia japonica TaxID=7064 RepID=A0AAW1N759_POPJA